MTADAHSSQSPSPWVTRWAGQIAPGGTVLDLACGAGRHARWLAQQGFPVVAVDRDISTFVSPPPEVKVLQRDLEAEAWPFTGRAFAAVVVTNYLHRPLFPLLLDALEPGGVLIYETFAAENEQYGRPSRPEFLLQPGELLQAVHGRMKVIAYEDLLVESPNPAVVQRICAKREGSLQTLTPQQHDPLPRFR